MNKIFEKIHGLEMIARIHIWQAHNSYVNFLYFPQIFIFTLFLYRNYILINIKSTERTYDIKWEGRIFYCHRVMGFIGNFIIQYPFVPDHFWERRIKGIFFFNKIRYFVYTLKNLFLFPQSLTGYNSFVFT